MWILPSLLVFVLAVVPDTGPFQGTPVELTLMTFNIRYGTADDGPNSWPYRRALVADIIAREAPDLLAIQEGLAFQLDELKAALRGYRKLGQHRDGGSEGEFSGIYVKEARLRVLDWGEIWLSPAPDSVGARGWDAALPRMAVWADVAPVQGGAPIRVYGTHFDHLGETARLESARLILRHSEEAPPTIVMGDLNAGEDSAPLEAFFERGYRSAFRTLHPDSRLGTFNGFIDPLGGDRIDHILLDPRLEVLRAEILDQRSGSTWPSDHYPVVARILTTSDLRAEKPSSSSRR